MDDFNVSSLHESKNEWGARLLTILTPLIIEGFKSIFDESLKICKDNNEHDKYLMTFQNFITRIPKWNSAIIEVECSRIIEKSCCKYLEELVTCVHIIQLKLLTAMRSGQKQKKIDVNIPKLADFIHKAYVNSARKLYKNVYLFELNIPPLQTQKNNRELEIIVQECVLNTVRESIPVESILRAYMDESVEENIEVEVKEQIVDAPAPTPAPTPAPAPPTLPAPAPDQGEAFAPALSQDLTGYAPSVEQNERGLKFNNVDMARDAYNVDTTIPAPKDYETLENISKMRQIEQQIADELNSDNVKLTIHTNDATLNDLDFHDLEPRNIELIEEQLIDFEEL
jgi:hypothetical protein